MPCNKCLLHFNPVSVVEWIQLWESYLHPFLSYSCLNRIIPTAESLLSMVIMQARKLNFQIHVEFATLAIRKHVFIETKGNLLRMPLTESKHGASTVAKNQCL
ncbi:hypothetical protein KIL84_020427 [Mauremys mutica]|uniref:Uncharacterized protein n=1 Tax=Mauremys mutica TaxID=74926 RepID=A0A9D4BAY3_9SAUR|nr:hypothetical protein KIL84_020427 [Mauremys mutica]